MAIETSATQQSRRPRHNPENNNPIDNGRENLHSMIGGELMLETGMKHIPTEVCILFYSESLHF
jgi:hypothetical protein